MYQQDYYVLKESGTYANALEAFGLATILNRITGEQAIQILDEGHYFHIRLNKSLSEDIVESVRYFQAIPYVKVKNDKTTKRLAIVYDYEAEKSKRDNYNNFINEIRKQKPANMNKQIEDYEPKPHPDYDIFSGIYQLKAIEGYKKAIFNIFDNIQQFKVLIDELLYLYSQPEDLEHQSINRLKKLEKQKVLKKFQSIKSLQLFNPHQGKGLNEPKANRLENENLSAFWLREWMKMVGSYKAMTIKSVKISNRSWDTKIYVLCPKNIDFNQLLQLHFAFKPKLRGLSAVKLDITTLLRFCEIFIQNIPEYQEKKKIFSRLMNPHHFINGFYTAYLKDLGQNKAVSNLSFLQLPSFIDINSYDDGQVWLQTLQEHYKIIGTLKEDATGSCIQMLQNYRQFLTSSDFEYLFDFLIGYSGFLMQEIAKEHYYVVPFSLKNMEVMFMKSCKEYLPILQSEGFKNVATAIRKSTISLQYTPKGQRLYEVKYGIAQDLKRKSDHKNELVEYLSELIAFYNAENARVKERKGDNFIPRANVKQQDIEEVIQLIDEYGSNIVGRLLAAYGYAFDRKEKIKETIDDSLMEVENV